MGTTRERTKWFLSNGETRHKTQKDTTRHKTQVTTAQWHTWIQAGSRKSWYLQEDVSDRLTDGLEWIVKGGSFTENKANEHRH